MSSNFGSSFASKTFLHDVNHDKYIDMVSVSVDGELMVNDLKNGETLINSNWPVYLSNDHFFSKPFVYIHGENINKEFIALVSHKGRIYHFDWNGVLVKTRMIHNIYLRRNWTFVQYKDMSEIISMKLNNEAPNTFYEMFPEVFVDVTMVDLSVEGVMNDLIIPVSFVTEEKGPVNAIVSAIVVFNMASESIVDMHFISVSQRDSEYPGYILSNIEIMRHPICHVIVTVASGVIYQLRWNMFHKKFTAVYNSAITYNQAPHNCHLTTYCSDMKGHFMANCVCCIFVDYYGHVAMMDLGKHRPLWEYTVVEGSVPTSTKIFVDDTRSPYVVFANDKGWIHCISLLTATSKESFPLQIPGDSFSSSPEIVYNKQNQLFLLLVSDNGHLYLISTVNPKQYRSVYYNPNIASYLPPILLQSERNTNNVYIFIHSKNGFIFKLELPNFRKKDESVVSTAINSINPTAIGTLYGAGSTFSFSLTISDPGSEIVQSTEFYTVKVFLNEYLYYTHKQLHSGHRDTDLTIVIDLDQVNRTLVQPSVFIFATATIIVTDSTGITFSPDLINVRINYDFQFELVWMVYLTFFVCCTAILLFHFHDSNRKLHIPVYTSRDQ